jgi:hypothetical protein
MHFGKYFTDVPPKRRYNDFSKLLRILSSYLFDKNVKISRLLAMETYRVAKGSHIT